MARSVQQFRPSNDPNAPVYAPMRDLANIYPPMMVEVLSGMQDEAQLQAYQEIWGITKEAMAEAITAFVEAHRLFVKDKEVSCPADAFVKAGFLDVAPAARAVLFTRIGEVVTGGFFVALRDITYHGFPVNDDFIDFVTAGRTIADRLSGHRHTEVNPDELTQLRTKLEETERALKQAQEEYIKEQMAMADRAAAQGAELQSQKASNEAMVAKLQKYKPLLNYITEAKQLWWLPRLGKVLWFAYRVFIKKKV